MSEEGRARVSSKILFRVLRSLLLAMALVCATALPPAGRADAEGGLIAFEANGEIYLADASGGTPSKVVSGDNGVYNMQPALSPDGARIAFSSRRDGKFSIYIVGVDGGGLRRLTDGPDDDSEPTWSPDGSRIAFVRGFDATGSGVVVLTCMSPGDILTVGVDDGEVERPAEVNLTRGLGGTDPAWSPDGKRIAFASDRAGSYDIYTMSSESGGDVRRLTEDESAEADPAWSPDGSWIAYTGHLSEDRTTQCGNMPIVGDGDGEEDSLTLAGGPYIYKMAADGSQQKNLTDVGRAAEPDWSPDGSRIVFAGRRKGEDVELYLIASEGAGAWIQLTSDPAQESSPSWVGTLIR
jgi:Tol biopolymer transport system component